MRIVRRFALVYVFAMLAVFAAAQQPDPLTGTWVGDFGPSRYDRNPISLDLKWDGKSLTGTIKPGPSGTPMYRNFDGIPIEKASFDPKSGAVKFEALFKPRERRYVIVGKLDKGMISGSWNRGEGGEGDF